MKVKNCIRIFVIFLVLLPAAPSVANITVKLMEPKWEFLLQNQPQGASEAQLTASESSFARSIQPLLAANDYVAIRQAFDQRDIVDDSAALRLLRGQVLLSLKQYDKAEQALKAALEIMPGLALAHRSLSMVYMLEKQYKQARQHLARSIELGIADAQVYGQLAFVNLQLGQAASAVAGYQYALLLELDNDQWRQGLLYALVQAQAFDQAQALIDELLGNDPGSADLWLQRGQLALKQERPQQAIASLEKALQLGEGGVGNNATAVTTSPIATIVTTAQLHIQSGSPRRAVELLGDNMAELVEAGNIDVVDQIAAWLAFHEDWPQLEKLNASLHRSKVQLTASYRSRFAVYQAQRALSLGQEAKHRRSGKWKKSARKHLQEAIEADPTNGEALLAFATLLRDQHRSERAVLYYMRAEALPMFKERALLGRAQLEIYRQEYSEALRLLRSVAQVNPSRSDVLANIQSLENLVRSQG